MTSKPIDGYGMLSDCRSAALVSSEGSVDWLSFPRFDSPSVFGRLLGEDAGFWSIRPAGDFTSSRRYAGPTMVLETEFLVADGALTLSDALVLGDGYRGHDLGAGAPRVLLRQVSCTRGTVELEVRFVPRPEYGLIRPFVRVESGGIFVRGGADVLVLTTSMAFDVIADVASARVVLTAGDVVGFALHSGKSWEDVPSFWTQEEIFRRLDDTVQGWTGWSRLHQTYTGPWQDLVDVSGRVLQALTFYPTGANVAAPTTSLPEAVGDSRNWDYRYTWIRDASMTLQALWVAACPDEAGKFFRFLAMAASGQLAADEELQIMCGVGGERDLSERELPHLPGWRSSLPGEPRHFLYSKLMCWVAVDRAISLADLLDATDRVSRWKDAREQIADARLTEDWSEDANAYTQTFGSKDLDASALMLSIVGFLPADHPRIISTIEAIEQRLTDTRGLVYRYAADDGLPGTEGTFLLCTFWLAHAFALAGYVQRAEAAFASAAGFATELGLLSEEVAPDSNELLGNFPQAFSHIGLVNAAWAISLAGEKDRHSGISGASGVQG